MISAYDRTKGRQRCDRGAYAKGMTALAMNTRKPVFADIRTREALSYLFDFEWVNKSLFEGVYKRTSSFFEGSDLASTGIPASEKEKPFSQPILVRFAQIFLQAHGDRLFLMAQDAIETMPKSL